MSFSVTILGSSSAKPTLSRHPSAQVVNVHEQYYLVDAGEGVQQQLIRYGINPLRLRAVFISHLHGDHVFGLFPLISTLALYGRKTPLRVFAPAPMGEILACHLKYFDSELPYPVVWTEVDTTKHALLMENRTLEVWSIPLRHRVPTAGFLFREKEPALNVDKFKITKYGLSVAQITAAKRGEDVTLSTGPGIRYTENRIASFCVKDSVVLCQSRPVPVLIKECAAYEVPLVRSASLCRGCCHGRPPSDRLRRPGQRVFLPVLSAIPALPLFRQCFGQQRQFQQHARELQLGKQF